MKEIILKLTLREKMTEKEMEDALFKLIEFSKGKICIIDKIKGELS